MLVAALSLLPFLSTLLGGTAVLRLRHRLHPIMGFAAGVVVATALADLLPEANAQAGESHAVLLGGAAVGGFLAFSAIEALVHRSSWEHQHAPSDDPDAPHEHREHAASPGIVIGLLGPLGLIMHSVMDGLAIGLGFQANQTAGVIVTMAVVGHDFADGMNVVTLAFTGGQGTRPAVVVLILDALAPVIGVVIGSLVPLSHIGLGVMLAAFSGVFLSIGAGHLLPEAQHRRPGDAPLLVLLAAAGAGLVLVVRNFAP